MQTILEQTDEDAKPVAHGGPKADLVRFRAVMSGNRDFSYPEPLFLKLDQNFCVEMKLIRALFKGDLLQGFAGIGPKARMILRKTQSERPVFEGGEELVPEKLIQRHAALQRVTGHAGAEHQIRLTLSDRLNEVRDAFGRVLHVSMENHDNVILFLDGVTQATLLVAAIAEITQIRYTFRFGMLCRSLYPIPAQKVSSLLASSMM